MGLREMSTSGSSACDCSAAAGPSSTFASAAKGDSPSRPVGATHLMPSACTCTHAAIVDAVVITFGRHRPCHEESSLCLNVAGTDFGKALS